MPNPDRTFLVSDFSDEELELFVQVLCGQGNSPVPALVFGVFGEDHLVAFLNALQGFSVDVPDIKALTRIRRRVRLYFEFYSSGFTEAAATRLAKKHNRAVSYFWNLKHSIEELKERGGKAVLS